MRAGLSIECIGILRGILPGEENIIEVMIMIKTTGESVNISEIQASFINMRLHTWIIRFTLHINSLLRSAIITIKLKLKSHLLLKALYLEATSTSLRFAAKHYSISQFLGGCFSYSVFSPDFTTLSKYGHPQYLCPSVCENYDYRMPSLSTSSDF